MKVVKPKLRNPVQIRRPVRMSTQVGTDVNANLGMAFPIHMGKVFRTQSPLVGFSARLQWSPLQMTAAEWKRKFFPRSMHNSLLFKIGAFVSKEARDSIHYRKNPRNASAPGTPPHAHKPGSRRWFRMIQFGYYQGGVIVGSVYFPNKGNTNLTVPEAQEHGGRKIISFRQPLGNNSRANRRKRSMDERRRIAEAYRRGEARATTRRVVARYRKRAFMEPALLKVKQKNSQLFRGLR